MLTRCPFCYKSFAGNDTVEHFPVGRRVAYDPRHGRLWAVCEHCRRWSLAPIQERWEAVEELERLVRDRARLRARTDHISLLRAGDVEIVRIGGEAPRREESHWRYGQEYAGRRRRARLIEGIGEVLDGITTGVVMLLGLVTAGAPLDPEPDSDKWLRWMRLRRFGRYAWAGDAACEVCGQPLPPARFEDRPALVLEPTPAGRTRLRRRCRACGVDPRSGVALEGPAAEHVARRMLAYVNYTGADAATLAHAVGLLDRAGSSSTFLAQLPAQPLVLGRLPGRVSFALEIAFSDEHERELLQLDVAALALRWREEEALAAIVDGELTPLPRPPRGP